MWRRVVPTVVALCTSACSGDEGAPASRSQGEETSRAGRIALASERDGNGEIHVMSPDGTKVTRLTNDPAIEGVRRGRRMATGSRSGAIVTATSRFTS
jgi:hypothetical protein